MVVLPEAALLASFLDQHGLAGKLRCQRRPKRTVEVPPGVVGGKVDELRIEGWREARRYAVLFLPDGDELLRPGCADHVFRALYPDGKGVLREDVVVIHLDRIE